MGSLLSGLLLLGVAAAVTWRLLPLNGRPVARVMLRGGFAGELTGLLLLSGFAFGAAMIAAGALLRP